jgi:hypothetical protein
MVHHQNHHDDTSFDHMREHNVQQIRTLNDAITRVFASLLVFVVAIAGLVLVAGAVLIANGVGLTLLERRQSWCSTPCQRYFLLEWQSCLP